MIPTRTDQMVPKPLSLFNAVRLLGFSFATTFSANVMNPGLFGHKILELGPAGLHNTFLGLLTFMWSAITIFNLPIVGTFSDRSASRLGKRIPFLILGTFGMSAAVMGVSFSNTITMLLISVIFLSLFDDTIIAPWLALFRESTSAENRGQMAGYKAFLDILAVIGGRQIGGIVLSSAKLSATQQEAILGGAVALLLISSLFATPSFGHHHEQARSTARLNLKQIYGLDMETDRVFMLWLGNRLLFWMGFVILGTFSLFFALDVLGMPEAEAHRYVGNLTMAVGAAILLIAVPAGRLADRFNRRKIVAWSCFLASLGTATLVLFESNSIFWIAGILVGVGSGIYMSSSLALLTDIVPDAATARYMGMAGVASAVGGAAARLMGGIIVDPLNLLIPKSNLGHLVLFGGAAAVFLLAGLAILAIPPNQQFDSSPSELQQQSK